MSAADTFKDLQEFRSKQTSLRKKWQERKRGWEDLLKDTDQALSTGDEKKTKAEAEKSAELSADGRAEFSVTYHADLEIALLEFFSDVALELPIDSDKLVTVMMKPTGCLANIVSGDVEIILDKLALQNMITLKEDESGCRHFPLTVVSAQYEKIAALHGSLSAPPCPEVKHSTAPSTSRDHTAAVEDLPRASGGRSSSGRTKDDKKSTLDSQVGSGGRSHGKYNDLESLLSLASTKEKATKKIGGEILDLLNRPTAKEKSLVDKFKSADGIKVQEFCPHGTKEDCAKVGDGRPCGRLHFRKIIQKHTDTSLGDCSFLNTCFHMNSCKYIHYEVDYSTVRRRTKDGTARGSEAGAVMSTREPPTKLYPPQWIQCDIRTFDLSCAGKCAVLMADPPWDIHMELPYGTMSDDEMRNLNVQCLQDEGLIFLWVTGRAMELGRDCLKIWGYEQVDELIWVKTNQLQRIIRTGRTGHWLNHGKEHCLVGLKGPIELYNRGLDCDVIVAEVRETSHKPDEIYGVIERLSPGTRKVEMFGRMHNVQPNWITLGNQLDGVRLLDPDVVAKFKERYPDGNCLARAKPPDPPAS